MRVFSREGQYGFHIIPVPGPDNDFHGTSFSADLEVALTTPDKIINSLKVQLSHDGRKRGIKSTGVNFRV